ncbi:hypothetical protein C2S51_026446 [Perilla frutescens var. frutescens]|nr:hypothetical protein C2S51_026446 [Perilla frutescens var. frutescens]
MSSCAELKRAGEDGFAIVENYMVRPRPSVQHLYHYHPSKSVEHHMKPVSAAKEKMFFYEGVQFRGAVSIMDSSKRKSRTTGY